MIILTHNTIQTMTHMHAQCGCPSMFLAMMTVAEIQKLGTLLKSTLLWHLRYKATAQQAQRQVVTMSVCELQQGRKRLP